MKNKVYGLSEAPLKGAVFGGLIAGTLLSSSNLLTA